MLRSKFASRPTREIERCPQLHQGYVAVVAPVVVVLVVDYLLHGVSCMLSHFGRAACHNAGIDHPAGYLRQPVADIWEERANCRASNAVQLLITDYYL